MGITPFHTKGATQPPHNLRFHHTAFIAIRQQNFAQPKKPLIFCAKQDIIETQREMLQTSPFGRLLDG